MAVYYYSHRHQHLDSALEREILLARATQMVWFFLAIVEAALILRFGLKLLGANPVAPFAGLVYGFSNILLAPFRYLLPAIQSGRAVLEWTTLVAMLIYWLAAWAITRIVAFSISRPRSGNRVEVA